MTTNKGTQGETPSIFPGKLWTQRRSGFDLVVNALLRLDAITIKCLNIMATGFIEGMAAYGRAHHGYPPNLVEDQGWEIGE